MPWDLPEDLKMFQRETIGGAVIMGRRTWESLPERFRPLKGRFNVVITRSDLTGPDAVVTSIEDALAVCRTEGYARIYGMGGASVYRALLPVADRLLLTEVDIEVGDADTYFPDVDETEWREVSSHIVRTETPGCVMRELLRDK